MTENYTVDFTCWDTTLENLHYKLSNAVVDGVTKVVDDGVHKRIGNWPKTSVRDGVSHVGKGNFGYCHKVNIITILTDGKSIDMDIVIKSI